MNNIDIKRILLGVDPGLAETGWGIISVEGRNEKAIDYGVISTSKSDSLSSRLYEIYNELKSIISHYNPAALAVEDIYFAKNVKTAIQVAQSRGIILMSAAEIGIEVFEYTPLQVKQALVGYGRADKNQIQKMVMAVLNLKEIPKPDHAADALAIALCHAHSLNRLALYKNAGIDKIIPFSRSGSRKRRRFL